MNVYESSGTVAEDVDLTSGVYNVRIVAGWRFRNVGPIWRDVGL